jgi:hypothetical protein
LKEQIVPPRHRGKSSLLAIASLALAAPTWAHHGIGRFDPARNLTVEGTLTGLDFVNPHSYVHFNAIDGNGRVLAMQCEMRAATVLRRSGWSPEMFVPGVAIKIVGRPHRDDPHYCYADTLTIGDAPTLQRYQQLRDDAPASRADRPFRLPSGKPNLAGDWAQEQYIMARPPQGAPNLVPKSLLEAVEAGEVAMADVPNHGWFPPPVTLTAAGQAASDALRNLPPERNPRLSCQITSVLFDWVFDGTINRITQSDDVITMEYGRGLTRTVRMDLEAHPARVAPSRAGHSIGHWDGDTLVVDTVGFESGSLAGAVAHSEELHVVERFTLDPETLALRREYVADDPLYFVDDYVGGDTVLPADAPFAVDACKELAYEYQPADSPEATKE